MIFAYLGPDTYLPLTSVLAAATGAILLFGRNLVRFVVSGFDRTVRSSEKNGLKKPRGWRRDRPQVDAGMMSRRAGRIPSHHRAAASELSHLRRRSGR